jgi:transcriptional regulator with XRE-family HTH domain
MTLKELREAKSLTQLEVAFKLNTTPGTVGNWERGAQEPRLSQVIALAELYEVPIEQIVEAIKNPKQR